VTPRQQLFLREYLIDLNATQAAQRAGYSPSYARRASYDLLRKPALRAAVEEGMAARARRVEIAADRVMREYAKLAFVDMRRLAEWGPDGVRLRKHTEIAEEDAAAIVELSRTGRSHGARIRLHDKRPALDALARHLGIFTKENAPRASEFRSAAQARARAVLKERIERVLKARTEETASEDACAGAPPTSEKPGS
jgi:phage terminase small subunit